MIWKPYRERREFIRAPLRVDVFCVIPNSERWLDVFTMRAKNISQKGIFLETTEIITPGKEVYVQFYLDNHLVHFKESGKVIWNRFDKTAQGIGIYFSDIGKKYEKMIEHYVLKHYDFGNQAYG